MKLTLLARGNYAVEAGEELFIVSRMEDHYLIDSITRYPLTVGISSNLMMAIQLISDYLYGEGELAR